MNSRARIAFLITALVLSVLLFDLFHMIAGQSPFCWDEAHHSTYGLLIARSLGAGDLGSFWRQTHAQTYWPFLHSWVSAPFLLAGGYTYASARAASAFLGAAALILVYLLGKKVAGRMAGVTGLILLALSPMYHVLSSTAMLENLGMVLNLTALLVLLKAWELNSPARAAAAGMTAAGLFLSKYIYGAFFGAALVAFLLSLLFWKTKDLEARQAWKSIPWVAGGFLLIWGLWILFPPTEPKLRMLFYRIGDTGGWNPFGYTREENLLFFLRALYYAYAFSPAAFILYLGGIAVGASGWKDSRQRILLIFFLVNFVPMSAIVNSQERFIYLAFGPLVVLAGSAWSRAWKTWKPPGRWLGLGLLLLLAAGDAHKFPAFYRQCANAVLSVNLHRDQLRLDYSTFFGMGEVPAFLRYSRNYFNPGSREKTTTDTGEIVAYVLSATDPRYPLCAPVPIGTLSPHLWHWHALLANRPIATSWNPNCAYFVLLEVEKSSPYNRLGNRHLVAGSRKWAAYFRRLAEAGLLREAAAKKWPEAGLGVRIFLRSAGPGHPGWKAVGAPP